MKAKHIIAVLGMTMILALAGCGSKGSVVEVTPTPAATPDTYGSSGNSYTGTDLYTGTEGNWRKNISGKIYLPD